MGQRVSVGERWRVENRRHILVEFTIERIDRNEIGELRAYGALDSGRPISFTIAALSKGMRGARLLRHADGHEPYRPKTEHVKLTDEEQRTASECVRTSAPRGMAKASDRMEEAYRMRYEQNLSVAEVATHFGISANRVSAWCASVRDKRKDQRHLEGSRT